MSHRVNRLLSHTTASASEGKSSSPSGAMSFCAAASSSRSPDDVVIVWSKRTAITKARKGGFKDSGAVEMLTPVLKALMDETKIDPKHVGDIVMGTVLPYGAVRATEVRMAGIMAGIPTTVPVRTVNRQCSSGLQAIADVAAAIKAGMYDCGIAGGVESMSRDPFGWSGAISEEIKRNPEAKDCLLPMGITSENVAAQFNISRKEQDELAVVSHKRAAKAIATGRFKDEIVPCTVNVKGKDGVLRKTVIEIDDGCKPDTSMETLSKLKPVFKKGGSTTAGNASQVSDGAAATLLMRRSLAEKLGMEIIGVFRSFAVAGVPPAVMGIGPAYAIPMALNMAGLSTEDIDLYEINEAFASQATYSVNKLGLSWDKVNVNGGAIAIGHPLGCTGARMTSTLLSEMKKTGSRFGVVSMCIGSGMGAAAVFERQ